MRARVDLLGDTLGDALETDFVRIADEFGAHEREMLERTRAFVRDEVLPVIAGYWERAEFPMALARRLGDLGLIGHGGEGDTTGLSPAAAGLVAMELSRGDGSLATFAGVQAGLVMRSIETLGSPEQQREWLPKLATVEAHVMRHLCDVEAIHTYEGTETIQTLLVGRDITGVGAFT